MLQLLVRVDPEAPDQHAAALQVLEKLGRLGDRADLLRDAPLQARRLRKRGQMREKEGAKGRGARTSSFFGR